MTNYDPRYHHRRSIRLKGYDYSQEGLYFITLCVKDRAHIFGKIEHDFMALNAIGKIAEKEWLNTPHVRNNIALHEHIIMPNHVHGIIEILFKKNENNKKRIGKFISPTQTIGSIIRGYKISTIKGIKDYFQKNNLNSPSGGFGPGELQFAPSDFPSEAQIKKIIQLNFKIWQRDYFDIIIRDERAYTNISNYIINNPKKWEEDKFRRNL